MEACEGHFQVFSIFHFRGVHRTLIMSAPEVGHRQMGVIWNLLSTPYHAHYLVFAASLRSERRRAAQVGHFQTHALFIFLHFGGAWENFDYERP